MNGPFLVDLLTYFWTPTFTGPKSLPLGVPTAKPWEAGFGPKRQWRRADWFIQADPTADEATAKSSFDSR